MAPMASMGGGSSANHDHGFDADEFMELDVRETLDQVNFPLYQVFFGLCAFLAIGLTASPSLYHSASFTMGFKSERSRCMHNNDWVAGRCATFRLA